jgi:hypothetical protein
MIFNCCLHLASFLWRILAILTKYYHMYYG